MKNSIKTVQYFLASMFFVNYLHSQKLPPKEEFIRLQPPPFAPTKEFDVPQKENLQNDTQFPEIQKSHKHIHKDKLKEPDDDFSESTLNKEAPNPNTKLDHLTKGIESHFSEFSKSIKKQDPTQQSEISQNTQSEIQKTIDQKNTKEYKIQQKIKSCTKKIQTLTDHEFNKIYGHLPGEGIVMNEISALIAKIKLNSADQDPHIILALLNELKEKVKNLKTLMSFNSSDLPGRVRFNASSIIKKVL